MHKVFSYVVATDIGVARQGPSGRQRTNPTTDPSARLPPEERRRRAAADARRGPRAPRPHKSTGSNPGATSRLTRGGSWRPGRRAPRTQKLRPRQAGTCGWRPMVHSCGWTCSHASNSCRRRDSGTMQTASRDPSRCVGSARSLCEWRIRRVAVVSAQEELLPQARHRLDQEARARPLALRGRVRGVRPAGACRPRVASTRT